MKLRTTLVIGWFVGAAYGMACGGTDDADAAGSAAQTGDPGGPGGPGGPGSGGGLFDGGNGSGGSGAGMLGDAACATTSANADVEKLPADIIWIVDQSGSMDQETEHVQAQINSFAALIDVSGIDYHVVMIADPDAGNAICVPPPLAGPACGDNTRFRLVPTKVNSNDGPELAVQEYPAYADFLRPNATKHFVFVTDDDSDLSAAEFTAQVLALQPPDTFAGFKVHAIYAYGTPGGNGCDGPFGSGASEGTVYTELVAQTAGAAGVICTGDWAQVFNDITEAVVAGATVSCDMEIPAPPQGETLDPAKVNVNYLQGGTPPGEPILRVNAQADCGDAGGWYYDDNAAPQRILLCPATCTQVQADPAASIQVQFGCESEFQPPS